MMKKRTTSSKHTYDKEALRRRAKSSVRSGDEYKSRGKRSVVLDLSKLQKEGVEISWYKPKSGRDKNMIDILPFEVSQKWYPKLRTFNRDECGVEVGKTDYKLEVPIHYDVGSDGKAMLCLKLAFGKTCIICDEQWKLWTEDKEKHKKAINKLKAKWRVYYNIYEYDSEDDSIKIWDISYHNFETHLKQAAYISEDEYEDFCTLDDGKSVEFKGREKTLGKNTFIEAEGITFQERDPYEESTFEEVYQLDAALIIPTVEDVKNAFYETETEDKNKTEEDEIEEDNTDTDNEEPKPRRRQRATRNSKDEENESGTPDDNKCPADGKFGIDTNELEECTECPEDTFDACSEENERLSAEKKARDESKPTRRKRR
jgi:hypothetical protein